MHEIAREGRPYQRVAYDREGAKAAPREHRLRAEDPARRRDSRGRDHLLRLGGLHRHVRGAARSRHLVAEAHQAALGVRGVLARRRLGRRRCSACAAPPSSPRKSWTRTSLRLEEAQEARPPQDRARDGPLLAPRGRPGIPVLASQGQRRLERAREPDPRASAQRGYGEVRTPMLLSDELWKRSGHYDHFRDDMYFLEIDERSYAVKPMNCPGRLPDLRHAVRTPTGSCRCAWRSSATCTATSCPACCTAWCACGPSPRTTRTSTAPRTSSRPRSGT